MLSNTEATFNLANVNLLSNPNVNPKNGVAYKKTYKLIWRTVKLLFSNKGIYGANIKSTEKDQIIQSDDKIAERNGFRKSLASSLNINESSFVVNDEHKNIQDSTGRIIVKYKFYASILINNNKIRSTNTFLFEPVTLSDIHN